MKTVLKIAGAMGALTLMATTAAQADYVIMQDTSFPSVVYFEFDEPVVMEPQIISVPSAAVSPVAAVDTMVTSPDPIVMAPSAPSPSVTTSGPISFNERLIENAEKSPDQIAEERAIEFSQKTGADLERAVEDAAKEDIIFSDVGLR